MSNVPAELWLSFEDLGLKTWFGVNMSNVELFQEVGGGVRLHFTSGKNLNVLATMSQVQGYLDKQAQELADRTEQVALSLKALRAIAYDVEQMKDSLQDLRTARAERP